MSGNYDVKPAKFGVPADYFVTRATNYGNQEESWHGVDLNINARPREGLLLQGGTSTGRSVTDRCEIVAKVREVIDISTQGLRVGRSAPNSSFCRVTTNWLTQVKFFGAYLIPRVDVQVSAAYQSLPGPQILADFVVPNALVAPSLGRDLAGGARNVTVNIVEPGTMYGERMNQLDFRVSKILRFGDIRTSFNLDLFNALNGSAVLRQNNNFGAWQRPLSILLARFVKISAQFDF